VKTHSGKKQEEAVASFCLMLATPLRLNTARRGIRTDL